jgi:hypothetical protein
MSVPVVESAKQILPPRYFPCRIHNFGASPFPVDDLQRALPQNKLFRLKAIPVEEEI